MRIVLASLLALTIGSAISAAQAAEKVARTPGRWCSIGADNTRHCYFKRHQDCMKAISDGSGVCVPNERNRGELPDDPENNSK